MVLNHMNVWAGLPGECLVKWVMVFARVSPWASGEYHLSIFSLFRTALGTTGEVHHPRY